MKIISARAFRRDADACIIVYSRNDLLRILHITPRQLANWERIGLVVSAESYSFADLLEIKKVRDLCAMNVRPTVIRESLENFSPGVALPFPLANGKDSATATAA